MANLRQAGFREKLPTLKVADLQGATATVCTIVSAEPVSGGRGRNSQQLLLMKFQEWPDRNYFPNPTGIGELMKGLGDETNAWRGKKIPLHVVQVQNPETREDVDALHVAPFAKWDELLSQAGATDGKTKTRRRKQ